MLDIRNSNLNNHIQRNDYRILPIIVVQTIDVVTWNNRIYKQSNITKYRSQIRYTPSVPQCKHLKHSNARNNSKAKWHKCPYVSSSCRDPWPLLSAASSQPWRPPPHSGRRSTNQAWSPMKSSPPPSNRAPPPPNRTACEACATRDGLHRRHRAWARAAGLPLPVLSLWPLRRSVLSSSCSPSSSSRQPDVGARGTRQAQHRSSESSQGRTMWPQSGEPPQSRSPLLFICLSSIWCRLVLTVAAEDMGSSLLGRSGRRRCASWPSHRSRRTWVSPESCAEEWRSLRDQWPAGDLLGKETVGFFSLREWCVAGKERRLGWQVETFLCVGPTLKC
jgi:hypothetical protein